MSHEKDIVESRQFLSRIKVWPKERNVFIPQWLSNFESDNDLTLAHALLDSFVHINDDHRDFALEHAIRQLSTLPHFNSGQDRQTAWNAFIDDAIAAIPLSHAGDGAASGYQYLRTAKSLGFTRCLDTEHLIGEILKSAQPRPVIFMDDITATGTQFLRNWSRNYTTPAGKSSLADLSASGRLGLVFFTPIVATRRARDAVHRNTGVEVHAAYELGDDYFASDAQTRLVPGALRSSLREFVTAYADQTGAGSEGPWGYQGQGLALSFNDQTPNNVLPIFQARTASDTWKPLITDD